MGTLFHQPLDVASRYVRLVMGEYGVEADAKVEKIWERRTDFLRLNPAATVPVLVLDEVHLVGATPITGYLAEAREDGGAPLVPKDVADRAEVRRLVDWALVLMEADTSSVLVLEKALKRQIPAGQGGGSPDTQAMRVARENLNWHLSYLAHLLTGHDWLTGERMTLADLAFGAAVSSIDYLGEVAWSDHPALKAWYAQLKSRPSFAPILSERVTGVVPPSHYEDPDF